MFTYYKRESNNENQLLHNTAGLLGIQNDIYIYIYIYI